MVAITFFFQFSIPTDSQNLLGPELVSFPDPPVRKTYKSTRKAMMASDRSSQTLSDSAGTQSDPATASTSEGSAATVSVNKSKCAWCLSLVILKITNAFSYTSRYETKKAASSKNLTLSVIMITKSNLKQCGGIEAPEGKLLYYSHYFPLIFCGYGWNPTL